MTKMWSIRHNVLLIIIVILLAGCSKEKLDTIEPDAIHDNNANPFETNDEEGGILGSLSHGYDNPELDEKEESMLPLSYDGGELVIDYFVKASGKAKNVGFLIYVDGIAQPYKVNETDSPYEYMHILDLEEDDKDTPFTFIFTPVTGKKGDTVNVTISSVYNPSFMPDMKETSSYGGYHDTLVTTPRSLVFNKDVDPLDHSNLSTNVDLSDVRLLTEPVTDELMERLSATQLRSIDSETLETEVFNEVNIENKQDVEDTFQINDSGKLPVTFKIFGRPGVTYKHTFYLNHKALSNEEGEISFETALTKGDVSVIEVELDLDKLDDFNTFFVVSTPVNQEDFDDDEYGVHLLKTSSILLYK